MDSKQAQIEKLVVDYFRHRADTDVYQAGDGIYQVPLKSEVAQTNFGGRRQLSLIFVSDLAYENPQSELITANHPFLDIIRNDLERYQQEDPHLAEAHLQAQLMHPQGRIVVPQLVFSGNVYHVDYQISYNPVFILTYRIIYETDERSDSIVHLCYDAATGSPRPELPSKLVKILPVEGRPSHTNVNPNLDLSRILSTGREEIEARVKDNVQIMGQQMSALLESEKRRLQEHYQNELTHIPARDTVSREQLKATLEKDIADLESKLTCHVRIQLLSVLRLWWPLVDYKVTFSGAHTTFTVGDIRYSSQTEQTTFRRCETCGNQMRYDVCFVEKHLLCGGRCSKGLTQCSTCHEVYCPEHGSPCRRCSTPVCKYDYRRCSYGKHRPEDHYCSECFVESFEGRPLCRDCLEQCDACHRNFPHERMAICRIGGEHVCAGHNREPDALICEDCKAVTCMKHGSHTSDGKWACSDHVKETTCCNRTLIQSRVLQCSIDAKELLCPDHRVNCFECGQVVCEKHSSRLAKHRGEFVCVNCRQACVQCSTDRLERSYVKRDLAVCGTCKRSICTDHRQVCAICNSVVCKADQRLSVDGYVLCPLHAQVATCCNRTFVRSQLMACCNSRNEALCPEHRTTCLGCEQAVCQEHRLPLYNHPDQFACQTCSRHCDSCQAERNYLVGDLATCQTCQRPVCSEHRFICTVGGEVVCTKDLRVSVNNESLCQTHAGVCNQCNRGNIHRSDQLRVCVTCRNYVCKDDSSRCQICQSYYTCNAHLQTQPACASCGRTSCGYRGCQTNEFTCQSCKMSYCRHCMTRSGQCKACESLRLTPLNDNLIAFLQRACSTLDDNTAQTLRSMLDAPNQLSLYAASNSTYQVLVVHFTPLWYQVWKDSQRMRIVITRTGQVKMVIQERADTGGSAKS